MATAIAAEYPVRPIRFIVPYGAGGPVERDVAWRQVALFIGHWTLRAGEMARFDRAATPAEIEGMKRRLDEAYPDHHCFTLGHIGDAATVSSINPPEGSAQAEHCARFYPIARDALLAASPSARTLYFSGSNHAGSLLRNPALGDVLQRIARDGKVFVFELDHVVRIRTGETGDAALLWDE